MTGRANNFDTLRFLAALAVLWSHSFSVSTGVPTVISDPVATLSRGQTTLGTIGVAVFFIISGYLIAGSFAHSRSAWRFVKARVLRLVPALWVNLLLLGLVLGPLLTVLALDTYFLSETLHRFFYLNGSFLGFSSRLPGVFPDNPMAYRVNVPLWTLQFEVECYVLVFLMGTLGLLNRWTTLALFLLGLGYIAVDGPYWIEDFQEWNHRADLATKFMAGAVLFHWRPRLDATVAAVCGTLAFLSFATGGFWLALPTVFAYTLIFVALGPWHLPNAARWGDLSYGLYIYAWPIKQLIVHLGWGQTWYEIGALATPLTLAAAFLSWHLVEKQVLALKDRMLPGEASWAAAFDRAMAAVRHAATTPDPPEQPDASAHQSRTLAVEFPARDQRLHGD